MNLSGKGVLASDNKLMKLNSTSLNPHAAEFLPFALRSSSGHSNSADASTDVATPPSAASGKAVLDRSESYASKDSDDEAHQYWRSQLPDDITPDFNVMGKDESEGLHGLSLSRLSINDANDLGFTALGDGGSQFQGQQLSPSSIGSNNIAENVRYQLSPYSKDPSAGSFRHPASKRWDTQIMKNDELVPDTRERSFLNGNSRYAFVPGMPTNESHTDLADVNPLKFLASQFPGFSSESLAEVYFSNGGDFNSTIEILTQLELQNDGGLNRNFSSKALTAANLTTSDLPALSPREHQKRMAKFSGEGLQRNGNPYSPDHGSMLLFRSSSSVPHKGPVDFTSAVRKMASQDSEIFKYNRNGSTDASVGSNRSSHVFSSSFGNGQGDRLQPRGSSSAAPVWIEAGEAVATMYPEIQEDALDHAQLHNAYFEQARQAYLIGNKALAKELTMKGQLHNMHMKAAHEKAQESIFRQRNLGSPDMQSNRRGNERIIDLHGLHVNEAIDVLKSELAVLRNAAWLADQHLQVYICVGTGHHSRGSHNAVRLSIAVQRYLLVEECLDYSEPQPGLLRVVV
ncbi:hypothetical protein LIER_29083 [Lithospermum erythrorhizon]|uniref:Smr domain-containing protein n=1 Tax=Lithospermum erythrorhizon TaxID=34254 RepID=A0AAV3RM59_LITER